MIFLPQAATFALFFRITSLSIMCLPKFVDANCYFPWMGIHCPLPLPEHGVNYSDSIADPQFSPLSIVQKGKV